jgi:hypothetical protein
MHPSLDDLAAYLEQPEAATHAATRRHVAVCHQCRRQLQGLASTVQLLRHDGGMAPVADGTAFEQGLIEDFVDGTLDTTAAANVEARLRADSAALKAALHYAAHSAEMQDHLQVPARASHSSGRRGGTPWSWWRGLLQWRPPAWAAIPLTAAAAFALAVVIWPQQAPRQAGAWTVAAYRDDAQLHFERGAEGLPGMGFFHAAGAQAEPFAGVVASYAPGAGLSLHWPAVARAQGYRLSILEVEPQGARLLAEQDTRQTRLQLPNLVLEPGRRYQWRLAGQTTDGERFHGSGGFVLTNNE